ncbi:MAG TPA: type 1 glutamine amidotransferase domain-containing protein [Nannocystaceae bacterium]|nr:type 1 glutamine amidotransferase domain-containing protein [Nannocystaceae bacterium]
MANVAMVIGPDFEDSEFRVPYDALREHGHEVTLVGVRAGETVKGKKGKESAKVELAAPDANARSFDALVIPGGASPDHLRTDEAVVKFVRGFVDAGRPIAAVCHGPQLLIEADAVEGKTMTSWPSVKTDLQNAGAKWVDREVAVDGNFITSRKPDDLAAFSKALLEVLPK